MRAHENQHNRTLHVVGTSLALGCVFAAVVKRRPSLLLLAPLLAYGFGTAGHLIFEKNRPLFLTHPVLALRGDLLMWWKTLCGEMEAEVERILRADAEEREREANRVSASMN